MQKQGISRGIGRSGRKRLCCAVVVGMQVAALPAAAQTAQPAAGTSAATAPAQPAPPPSRWQKQIDDALYASVAAIEADNPREAERLSLLALRLTRKAHNIVDEANAVSNLAGAQKRLGRMAEAEANYRRSNELSLVIYGADAPDTAVGYDNLGIFLDENGRHSEAETLHRRAIAIGERTLGAEDPYLLRWYTSLAMNLGYQGRYAEGLAIQQKVLDIRRRISPGSRDVSRSLYYTGTILEALGRDEEALPMMREALAIVEKTMPPESPAIGAAMQNLADSLLRASRASEAIPLLQESARILGKASLPVGEAHSQALLGKALADSGRYGESIEVLRPAIAKLRQISGNDYRKAAEHEFWLANALLRTGNKDEGSRLLLQSLDHDRHLLGPQHPDFALSLARTGDILTEQGDAQAALPLLEEAVKLADATLPSDHTIRIRAAAALGRALYATNAGDPARADALIEAAMSGADQRLARRSGLDPDARRDRHNLSAPFDVHIDADWNKAAQNKARVADARDDAFQVAQRAEASVVGGVVAANPAYRTALKERDARAIARDAALRRDLVTATRNDAEHAAARERRVAAERALQEAEAALARMGAADTALDRLKPVSIASVQASLAPDEALLHAYTVDEASYLWLITRDEVLWHRETSLGRKPLTALVQSLRPGTVADGRSQVGAVPDRPFDRNQATALYQKLLLPFEPALGTRKRLLISGSGPLASLPLSLLIDRQGSWVADRFAIANIATPTMLAPRGCGTGGALPCPPEQRLDLLAFVAANPALGSKPGSWRAELPALTAAEADAARQRFGTRARVVADAREAQVQNDPDLGRARFVLVAAHGLTRGPDGDPGIALAGPAGMEQEDGFLSAPEAAMLNLSADMVILSACDTGAGDGSVDGEAFSGLARSFLVAGAHSVVASQWRVSDAATARLIAELLNQLANGVPATEALQVAMRAVRTAPGGKWADPRYWAGFVLLGSGR
ncbi:CHAT domain-containing tetratricopeptide repeat protein [Sphingomonas pituitosa]|uniref:CHAT domain-containing tetratricopeptide repeat protein n=1 Tax=Sphingomonas pituitosa TaxID=99597 RepID=UPI000A05359E|nr:CHAT domain-containing tetratricopeptide repeat protein [Sphingomonas pituitosa]